MKTPAPSTTPFSVRRDRRRSPRLDASQHVLARLVPSGTPVRVVDLSFGGFLLESDVAFETGVLQQVRLYTAEGGVDVVVTGCVVHSRRDSTSAARSRFLTGFSLVGPHLWDAQAQYDRLLDAIAGTLSFEG